MLKYPCLVLDHDDTVVQSEATINYPFFCDILDQYRPGEKMTLEEYTHDCFAFGFAEMCRQKYAFTEQELTDEYLLWKEFVMQHTPPPFPGIAEIIHAQKAAGGIICVVSHSSEANIRRDYDAHFGIQPDVIYGWDYPEEQRKPYPYPLLRIMEQFRLSPSELLVVDDMKPACDMAKAVGAPIAFAGWGRENSPEITKLMESLCDYSFSTTNQLHDFLFKESFQHQF